MTRKPDYRLKILNKVSGNRCNDAGAAWINKDNSISIVLSAGIVLQENNDLEIRLFTIDKD